MLQVVTIPPQLLSQWLPDLVHGIAVIAKLQQVHPVVAQLVGTHTVGTHTVGVHSVGVHTIVAHTIIAHTSVVSTFVACAVGARSARSSCSKFRATWPIT